MRNLLPLLLLVSCQTATDGLVGPAGPPGPEGPQGAMGGPGRDGAGVAAPVSGSRLKLVRTSRTLTTDDGLEQVLSMNYSYFDSQLDSLCAFGVAGDDKTRCIPAATATDSKRFLDDRCGQLLAAAGKGSACGAVPPAPKYFAVEEMVPGEACKPSIMRTHIFLVGAEVMPTALYLKEGTTCKPLTAEQLDYSLMTYRFFRAGNEVPPSSFVAGTTTVKSER